MISERTNTLSKEERLSGKSSVSRLISEGKWGSCTGLKFCCLKPNGLEYSRILISVPKKFFKRAVKRNLLKRRIRESYRTQKSILTEGSDIMFLYNTPEILSFSELRSSVENILMQVNRWER